MSKALLSWSPAVRSPPQVVPQIDQLPIIERVSEVCRFTAARALYALDPHGVLQEWLLLTARVFLAIYIPLVGLSFIISILLQISLALYQIIVNLVLSALLLVVFCVVLSCFLNSKRKH